MATAREIAPGGKATPRSRSGRRLAPIAWVAGAALAALLIARGGGRFLHAIERALHEHWQLVLLAAVFEAVSIAGYIVLMHRVVSGGRLRPKDSYDITLAGTAATRLVPTAGLGGAAVTVWALRARGLRSTEITERLLAFFLILYGVYMAALLASGLAVATGLVDVGSGARELGLLGAALALGLSAAVLTLLAAPSLAARLLGRLGGSGPLASAARRGAEHLPALRAALGRAGGELRQAHPALLGAVLWWGFDIAVLTAMLHVFGLATPLPVVVLAYFLGTMFNVLPLPGSLSGGLAGALVATGAPAAGAIAAVMAYRTVAVWLPALSGLGSLAALRTTVAGWRAQGGAVSRTPVHKFSV